MIQALAQHKLGNLEEASQSLQQAAELIDANLSQIKNSTMPSSWQDWLIAEVLRREAKALIDGKPQKSAPRVKHNE